MPGYTLKNPKSNKTLTIALVIVALVIVGGLGVAAISFAVSQYSSSGKNSGKEDSAATLEAKIAEKVTIENGVFVYYHTDGFSPAVSVRLYVNSADDLGLLTEAVEQSFKEAWLSWPAKPSSVTVGVAVGEKPATPSRSGSDEIELDEVGKSMGLEPKAVHKSIQLSSVELEERYGPRS